MIDIKQFSVSYDAFTFHETSVRLGEGERIALVGPNGAGKSTLMKALGGRLPTYDGEVLCRGEEVRSLLPAYRAEVGTLPEKLLGFGWMTVAEHLEFVSSFFPRWDANYAAQLLDRLQLPGGARLGTLSKGMAMKLSFIAAEGHRPPLLLLDEPTSGLDPVVRRELITLVRELSEVNPSRLIVFSTHLLEDVELVAERVLLLRNGRLVADESLASIRARAGLQPITSVLYEMLSGGTVQ